MARTLTHKEKGFVRDVADGNTGTQAALNNYDTEDKDSAGVIASQNLGKLKIQQALKEMGFDSDNAKSVVAEILNDENNEPKDRLKAAENVFKVNGDYAAEKHVNLNIKVEPSDRIKELAKKLQENG